MSDLKYELIKSIKSLANVLYYEFGNAECLDLDIDNKKNNKYRVLNSGDYSSDKGWYVELNDIDKTRKKLDSFSTKELKEILILVIRNIVTIENKVKFTKYVYEDA